MALGSTAELVVLSDGPDFPVLQGGEGGLPAAGGGAVGGGLPVPAEGAVRGGGEGVEGEEEARLIIAINIDKSDLGPSNLNINRYGRRPGGQPRLVNEVRNSGPLIFG